MKASLLWIALVWIALTLEAARPDLVPALSLTLPVALGVMIWFRSATGILLGGAALQLRWLLQSTHVPVDVLIPVVVACWILTETRSERIHSQNPATRRETGVFLLTIPITVFTFRSLVDGAAPQWEWLKVVAISMAAFLVLRTMTGTAAMMGFRNDHR